MENTAAATALAIEKYHPVAIINQGTDPFTWKPMDQMAIGRQCRGSQERGKDPLL